MIGYKKNEKILTKKEMKNLELIFCKPNKEKKNDERFINENKTRDSKVE